MCFILPPPGLPSSSSQHLCLPSHQLQLLGHQQSRYLDDVVFILLGFVNIYSTIDQVRAPPSASTRPLLSPMPTNRLHPHHHLSVYGFPAGERSSSSSRLPTFYTPTYPHYTNISKDHKEIFFHLFEW
jgi:hypothetical protein